ncbi:hypothetical protein, partial [Picosynechococcus sp. NKBG042902]|uniref:hypothetical protein n=1 Tax=Picosynechococcus sp. NKBG042902 TaxID=490193 RepID=UPI001267AE70
MNINQHQPTFRRHLPMENLELAKLRAENRLLQKKLELAGAIAGKAKNVGHVLALVNADAVRDDGFYYKGESALTAAEYAQRLQDDSGYAHLFGASNGGTKATDNPW